MIFLWSFKWVSKPSDSPNLALTRRSYLTKCMFVYMNKCNVQFKVKLWMRFMMSTVRLSVWKNKAGKLYISCLLLLLWKPKEINKKRAECSVLTCFAAVEGPCQIRVYHGIPAFCTDGFRRTCKLAPSIIHQEVNLPMQTQRRLHQSFNLKQYLLVCWLSYVPNLILRQCFLSHILFTHKEEVPAFREAGTLVWQV